MWVLVMLCVDLEPELVTAMLRWAVVSAGEYTQQEVANLMGALAILSGEDLAYHFEWDYPI
jgi:hypothetical protein